MSSLPEIHVGEVSQIGQIIDFFHFEVNPNLRQKWPSVRVYITYQQ